MAVRFIQGPGKQYIYSTATATLTWVKRLPIVGGARQVNGSSINSNSLN